ncbi:inner nuclear membrane protein man1 lem domain containing protein [Holotrichia oblita]|uniref:Inner nuclear membrane protein man1 lem domain containing protein n=1 Tax=Holotrichia oblita TaxID=644536 RepID=A0ACB9SMU9_HOLOL|nr:inner nuclear membrane protein man1 lem domain containing protein [Holotrichia oblita]
MVDVANMSDAELRTKLLEFGFPVMPITGTTRKVMEKKLKILMENKNKVNNEGRRSLTRYSSEEESDVDVKIKKDKKRATMAAPPTRVTLRKTTRKTENDNEINMGRPIISEEKRTTRTTKVTTVESGFDTGSDSESEIIERSFKSPVNNHDIKKAPSPVSSSSYVETIRKYSPPKFAEDVISKPVSTTYSPRSTAYSSNASDYASDRLNQIRSRLSLGSPSYDRPLYSTTTSSMSSKSIITTEKDEDHVETPFLSNFTKRLSQLSSNSRLDDYKNEDYKIKEHDTNGSGGVEIRSYMTRPYRSNFQRDYQSAKQANSKNNLVSFAVIALAFLFFIVIAIAYMGLHSGQTAVDSIGASDLKVNYCDKSAAYKPGVNCIHLSQLRDAVRVYEIIKSELLKHAIDHRCLSSGIKPYMTEQDILHHINKHPTDFIDIHKSLRDMELLTLTNPQWETALVKINNDKMSGTPIRDFNELYDARGTAEIALTILDPSLPWSCSIYNKIAAIIQTAVILAVGFTAVYSLNRGYKYYKHYQQKQKDELFYMVERIIDTLQTNATEDGDNFLVINHVRDMILPINDRARMEQTWKRAIYFINKNESRVRTELQVVQGEPYEVWRWLGSPNLNTSGSRNKSWQGQAFETQVGSVNSLPCSPTPCLKIRGMVDDGDRNLHTIREAVLSKCAHQCRILHCAVDTNSKCVYLKCADQNDAAIAYRSLHGWWYAGNLVTVKYLRLERYLQRYPDSPVSGPPYLKALQPATDWSS